MPFRTQAVAVLTNHAADTTLDVSVQGLSGLPPEPWGHLQAIRSETVGPTTLVDHPVAAALGPGRLVGMCLQAEGHSSTQFQFPGPLNFLEGDEVMNIDDDTYRGTGAEDYFDSAFYFRQGEAGTPFAQWSGKVEDTTNDRGAMAACRWHILTAAIDFQDSLDFSMEIGPHDPSSLDRWVSTAFLYR